MIQRSDLNVKQLARENLKKFYAAMEGGFLKEGGDGSSRPFALFLGAEVHIYLCKLRDRGVADDRVLFVGWW